MAPKTELVSTFSFAKAKLYGADDQVLGGLNAFYLLVDEPETYGLPSNPQLPSRTVPRSSLWSIFTAFLAALGVVFAFRSRTRNGQAPPAAVPPGDGGRRGEGTGEGQA